MSRKRILYKHSNGNPVDIIVEVVPDQTILVKYLEDDRMVPVRVDNIIIWEDAPDKSTLIDE